jgi:hypothetical protein
VVAERESVVRVVPFVTFKVASEEDDFDPPSLPYEALNLTDPGAYCEVPTWQEPLPFLSVITQTTLP